MNERNDGGPAFPSVRSYFDYEGMTLRDWFIGQALAGLLSNPNLESDDYDGYADNLAETIADSILARR